MSVAAPASLSSLRDVAIALNTLGLPVPSAEHLRALAALNREDFLGDLVTAIQGGATAAPALERLQRTLTCLSPSFDAALSELGIVSEPARRAAVALQLPKRFESALACAGDQRDPRRSEALAWLEAALKPGIPGASSAQPANAPAPSSEPPSPAASRTTPATRRSHHVYGANAALCFNAADYQGKPGLMIDAARADGPKSYDWKRAAHIWLRATELAGLFAVFRRVAPEVAFNNHGNQNDKSFSLQAQDGHFFARVCAGRDAERAVRAVKILPTDAHAVSVLVLEQLLLAHPGLPPQAVMDLALAVNRKTAA